MSMGSTKALLECMNDLHINRNTVINHSINAEIHNLLDTGKFGSVEVTFNCNPHGSFGPDIDLDETVKGFGIYYTHFKPHYQTFEYDTYEKELLIKGNGYSFTLTF